MSTLTFDNIDLAVHERLLLKIIGPQQSLAIIDTEGNTIWVSSSTSQIEFDGRYHPLEYIDTSKPFDTSALSSDSVLVHQTLGDIDTGHIGWIVLVIDSPNPLLDHQDHLSETLADIAHCIRSELSLNAELDDMANELSQRYEELNLLYLPGEEIETETALSDSLRQIVKDCLEYMAVDLAVILLPERRIWFSDVDPSSSAPGIFEEDLKSAMEEAFDLISSSGRNLVFNDPSQIPESDLLPALKHKLVASPVFDSRNRPYGFVGCLRHQDGRDFMNSDRKLMEVIARRADKLIQRWQDALTGLMNRSWFEDQIKIALIDVQPDQTRGVTVLLNIDQFELINDAYGFVAGDDLLKQLAFMLKDNLRGQDILARIGGDEFGMLLESCKMDQAYRIAERLLESIDEEKFNYGNKLLSISVSMGLVTLDSDFEGVSEVLTAADLACQSAKRFGGNRIEVFEADNKALIERQSEVRYVGRIDDALANNRFALFCQPIEPITKNRHHYEILLRLENQDGHFLSPDRFMGAAERYNRMPRIDRWVVSHALDHIQQSKVLFKENPICWGINLSGQSLVDEDFSDFVVDLLSQSGISPEWVYFEITETVAIRNFNQVLLFINRIKDMGHAFALDDFGSGYSSFAYLKNMPVDYIKIDGAFIRNLVEDPFD